MLMKLAEWLQTAKLSVADFAAQIGVHRVHVYKLARGQVMPRGDLLRTIQSVTAGAVTANDFYALPASSSSPTPGSHVPPECDPSPAAAARRTAAGAVSSKRKRNHTAAAKKAWRSRKRRAALRAQAEARP